MISLELIFIGVLQRAAHTLGKRRDVMRVALGDQQDGELVAA